MTRRMITKPDGSLLNTCTSDAIIQILRFLKRAFWPFAWDSSQGLAADSRGLGTGGGFAAAAKVRHLLSLAAAHAQQICQAGYALVPTAAGVMLTFCILFQFHCAHCGNMFAVPDAMWGGREGQASTDSVRPLAVVKSTVLLSCTHSGCHVKTSCNSEA